MKNKKSKTEVQLETDIERGMQTDVRNQDDQDVQKKEQIDKTQEIKPNQAQEKTDIQLNRETNKQSQPTSSNQQTSEVISTFNQKETKNQGKEAKAKNHRIGQDELFDNEDSFKIIASVSAIEKEQDDNQEKNQKNEEGFDQQRTVTISNIQLKHEKSIQKQTSEISDHQALQSAEIVENDQNKGFKQKEQDKSSSLHSNIPSSRRQKQGEENVFQGEKFTIKGQQEPGEKKYQEEVKESRNEEG